MKKLLLTIALILSLSMPAWAVDETTTVSGDELFYNNKTGLLNYRMITIAVLAASDDAAMATLDLNGDTTGLVHGPLLGWFAYSMDIDCNHAGTEPTEDTDITILQNGGDMLDGNGTDMLDNTAERSVYFATDGLGMPKPISRTITVTPDSAVSNAVNSATCTLYFYLVP